MKKLDSVLLVDDDPACLYIARSIMKRHGLTDYFFIAHNGLEALELMRKASSVYPEKNICPSLVLVDIKMPVMNGFEFIEKMQQLDLPFKPAIAILTTSNNNRDTERAEQLGINGYLNKPLTWEALSAFVNENFEV